MGIEKGINPEPAINRSIHPSCVQVSGSSPTARHCSKLSGTRTAQKNRPTFLLSVMIEPLAHLVNEIIHDGYVSPLLAQLKEHGHSDPVQLNSIYVIALAGSFDHFQITGPGSRPVRSRRQATTRDPGKPFLFGPAHP